MGQSGSKQYSTYSLVTDSDQNFVLERMDDNDSSEDELFDISSDKRGLTRVQGSEGLQTEAWYFTLLQIFIPFILAGLGMVAAGLVLDIVQHWDVFIEISEIFILVPALLGLKGNLVRKGNKGYKVLLQRRPRMSCGHRLVLPYITS